MRRLLALLPHKEIGWKEIGEEFTRYTLLKTPWFAVYLHRLYCPNIPPHCHDHPWSFIALLLKGGYMEQSQGDEWWIERRPGEILLRPAEWSHNIYTPNGVSWSLIIRGPRRRDWGFHECR